MQIAPTARLAAPAPAGTPDINRYVALANIRMFDKDDHVTFTTHQQLVTGGVVGAREGYASLRAAMSALSGITRGLHPAAVVVERDGRFLGRILKGRDLERGTRAPLVPMYFETDERLRVVRLETRDRAERIRALVDGDWSQRFRAR